MFRKVITSICITFLVVGTLVLGVRVGMVAPEPIEVAIKQAAVHENPPARAFWMKRVCEYEDSLNCAWNADVDGLGNGGKSFYIRRLPNGLKCTFFVDRKHAKKYDNCTHKDH